MIIVNQSQVISTNTFSGLTKRFGLVNAINCASHWGSRTDRNFSLLGMINIMIEKSNLNLNFFANHSTNKLTAFKNIVLIKIAVYFCINKKKH